VLRIDEPIKAKKKKTNKVLELLPVTARVRRESSE
jgi:hypothetical protein